MLFVKYPLETDNQSLFDKITAAYYKPSEITGTNEKIERTKGSKAYKEANYGNLRQFMDQNLKADETFIDFSNNPMLYFYLERPVPSYFNQYMQNTITPYLQKENLKNNLIHKSPLVIFSSIPQLWFDNTDGVPNPLRYSIIAQYIYDNYLPLTIIDKRFLWGLKGRSFQLDSQPKTVPDSLFSPKNYNLGYYPLLIGKGKYKAGIKPGNTNIISVSDTMPKSFLWLKTNISSGSVQNGSVNFFSSTGIAGSYSFSLNKGKDINYCIPLYVQYNFHRKKILKIEIVLSADCKINSNEFIYFQPQ